MSYVVFFSAAYITLIFLSVFLSFHLNGTLMWALSRYIPFSFSSCFRSSPPYSPITSPLPFLFNISLTLWFIFYWHDCCLCPTSCAHV